VERELVHIIQAIKDGVPALTLKNELTDLEARKQELEHSLKRAPAPVVRLHPNLAQLYSRKVADLTNALNADAHRHEASETIRTLIDEVRLVPTEGKLDIELFGELGALINLANDNPRTKEAGVQVTLVAGARNCLNLLLTTSVTAA
jgi:site-specific DNA recombinase